MNYFIDVTEHKDGTVSLRMSRSFARLMLNVSGQHWNKSADKTVIDDIKNDRRTMADSAIRAMTILDKGEE